jgi:hypothetical protein
MRRQTGSAIETWPTSPAPKKLFSRAKVRSTNWSTITNVPGGRSCLNDPTALSEITSVAPSCLSAWMFAR